MVFGPKFQYFFQLNEMRDEAKTWWLVFGPEVVSSYFFFFKKIRVALESRTLIWVPLVVTITLKHTISFSSCMHQNNDPAFKGHWCRHHTVKKKKYRKIRAFNLPTNYCKIYGNTVNFLQLITVKLTVYCKYFDKKLYLVCFIVFMQKIQFPVNIL